MLPPPPPPCMLLPLLCMLPPLPCRTMYFLEVKRECDGVRLRTWMQKEQDNIPTGGGEGAWWCWVVDTDGKKVGQCTNWRWRGSMMVSDWGRRCEESRHIWTEGGEGAHGVRLGMQMQRKWDDVQTGSGEGVWWCQSEDTDAKKVEQCTKTGGGVRLKLAFGTTCAVRVLVLAQGPGFWDSGGPC